MDITSNKPENELGIVKTILISILLGLLSSLAAFLFKEVISFIRNLIFNQELSFGHDLHQHIPTFSTSILIIFVPALFGLIVVWLTSTFAPEAGGHSVPEVMNTIHNKEGNMKPSLVFVKSIASALTIGSGGSAGREGPIVQICAAVGSNVGAILHLPYRHKVILIAATAAAGIASTFSTPLGGVLFALELLLLEITSASLIVVSITVSTSMFVSSFILGDHPAINVPEIRSTIFTVSNFYEILVYIPFGVLLGLWSGAFIKLLYKVEDLFKEWFNNKYLRHGVAMLIVGLMLFCCHKLYGLYYVGGLGYATILEILSCPSSSITFFAVILSFKLIATCLTLGTGGSGGVFTPALFMGAISGGLFSSVLTAVTPLDISMVDFVIAGMAGVVSATTGAMLTSVVMAFEMTRSYDSILPVLTTAAISYRVRHIIYSENIYSKHLLRRGIKLKSPFAI